MQCYCFGMCRGLVNAPSAHCTFYRHRSNKRCLCDDVHLTCTRVIMQTSIGLWFFNSIVSLLGPLGHALMQALHLLQVLRHQYLCSSCFVCGGGGLGHPTYHPSLHIGCWKEGVFCSARCVAQRYSASVLGVDGASCNDMCFAFGPLQWYTPEITQVAGPCCHAGLLRVCHH